jgi:tetratricopeptide (TPR) repeat protein
MRADQLIIFWMLVFGIATAGYTDTFKEAVQLLESKQYDQAEQLFKQLNKENKKDADVLYYLGTLELIKNDHDQAIDYLKQSVKLKEDERYFERLGDAYGMKAQNSGMIKAVFVIPKMREAWETAIALDAQNITSRQRLFTYYLVAPGIAGGDKEKALHLADEVLGIDSLQGYVLKASYYRHEKKYEEAESQLKAGLVIDGSNQELLRNLGFLYLDMEKFSDAEKWLRRNRELHPDEARSYDLLGDYFLRTNQPDSALHYFNTAIERDESLLYVHLKKGQALAKLLKTDEAREVYQLVRSRAPNGFLAKRADELLKELNASK